MAAQPPKRPKQRPKLQTGTVINADPAAVSRHLSDLATAVNRIDGASRDRTRVTQDLVIGKNKVNHGLGVAPRGVNLTPTVADATFAWALISADSKQATISVVGANQPGAALEFWV